MRALLHIVFAVAFTFGSSLANAGQADFVQLDSFGSSGRGGGGGTITINLGTWAAGDGTQTWSYLNCAASANYSNSYYDPPPSHLTPTPVHEPYHFMLESLYTPPGYYLYLGADSGNTGNARILVRAEHQDVKAGTGFQTLSDGVYDTHVHEGQFNGCRNGDNSELQITVPGTELEEARAGSYTGFFRGQIEGGTSGTATSNSDFYFQITVANIVRISHLNDIVLGVWDGASNMTGSETFCIYSNSTSAGYTAAFSSANQSGSTFRLANATAGNFVPYTLQFNDAVGSGAGTIVGGASISGVGNNSAADCGGTDNATMTVTVLASNLVGLAPEPYSDTVTLLVAPQ